VIQQPSHWRVASAAAIFVLAGSSAVALAMHDKPTGSVIAYQSWPKASRARGMTAARQSGIARAGLRLMSQAAAASRTTAFSGILVSRSWGPAGARTSLAAVWHRPGGQTVAQPVSSGTADGGSGTARAAPGPSASVVILPPQFALLESGYMLDYAGIGSADGRSAVVVAVERPNGTLAARYWLDRQTKLPLRRQLFGSHARIVSDISFASLRIGAGSLDGMPAALAQPWTRQLSHAAVSSLRAQGWPLPVELPGGMMLFAASATPAPTGQVIGLSYSDGLSVISLFVQRGDLPRALAGWQRIAIAGHNAYAVDPDDQTIAWSSDGYVFTVVADAPAGTVDQAISALPHSGPPGFWARLGRGFHRLASWANPFR
jgi:sigma-E factor negative regulatory protein RseB